MKKSYLYICVELNVYLFITQVRIVRKISENPYRAEQPYRSHLYETFM